MAHRAEHLSTVRLHLVRCGFFGRLAECIVRSKDVAPLENAAVEPAAKARKRSPPTLVFIILSPRWLDSLMTLDIPGATV